MTSKIFTFILGLVIGAAVCAAVFNQKSQPATSPAGTTAETASSNEIAGLKSQLASVQSDLDKANAANDKLTASVQKFMQRDNNPVVAVEKPKKPQSGFAALFGGDGTNGMSAVMKMVMEQQTEGKISTMKAKLNLTPDQEAAIRNILTNQLSKVSEMTQKMMAGDLTKDEMSTMSKNPVSEDDQIKALLSADQLVAYDEYKTEEKAGNARLTANAELMQMQSTLQLTADEQDKVFAVLADQAQARLDATGNNSGSPLDMMRDQAAKKTEALRAVLTPEQFERYQKFQEQQLQMIEAFMPKDK